MHETSKYRSRPNGPLKQITFVADPCDYTDDLSVSVDAYQAEVTHDVTTVVKGKVEAGGEVTPGMWVVRNPGGETYAMPETEFRTRYEPST